MSLVRARRVVLLLGALLLGAPRADSGAAIDPLPTLLTDDWDEAQRGAVQERVRALGASACPTLAGYARASDPRAREHAVRAMADAGCSDLADYRGFFSDASAWVVDAVIDAASRLRMAAATPFLLAHVDDRRRLVSDDGALEIAEQADRGLRRLTAQPIPRLPAVRGEKMSGDPAAWRAWYAAHRAETPALWIESGRTVLAGALRRAPADLDVGLVCIPDEAPRVLDEIPCTLTITNVGTHRLALAIGEPVIRLEPHQATAPTTSATSSASPPPSHGPGKPKTPKPAPAASTAVSPDGADAASKVTDADLALMAGHFLELAPGASVRRSLSVGPVKTAGRYDVHAGLIDLARPLFAGASGEPAGPIESVVSLRFEP
jgi:hypothetical protein